MQILIDLWQRGLYQPLVNALVFLYNTIGHQNLGWSVIYLTIALRVVLLPFSIMSERNKLQYERMQGDIDEAHKRYRSDPAYLKQYVRRLAKKYHIHPWAKSVVLTIQLLVLVLLYQVFITGIQGTQLAKILYDGIDYPGRLNTVFTTVQYGPDSAQAIVFDVGQHSALWAGLVGVILFIDVAIHLRHKTTTPVPSDITYWIFFPLASFLILWYLPMVKSLFILTSLACSYVLTVMRLAFFRPHKQSH